MPCSKSCHSRVPANEHLIALSFNFSANMDLNCLQLHHVYYPVVCILHVSCMCWSSECWFPEANFKLWNEHQAKGPLKIRLWCTNGIFLCKSDSNLQRFPNVCTYVMAVMGFVRTSFFKGGPQNKNHWGCDQRNDVHLITSQTAELLVKSKVC